ncbi:hypothetical protein COCC4DRAFT_144971 [Bipolaris maydis ATCC 48331]|uniref:RNase MRP protein 1 RNA binding domain-containing protein n=2 Tax=Cochliobolus heterostrophus TaxID=5016 RepID=M2U0G0_COCH5|nr:uncharacterized protein COCC4DRAFT_144971 [Bipolaris maydis ATCC 48331]EMD92029.1 hypothetical protein COCHEDRAFT_1213120 [Bipolaris maydis C5]KAH7553255.1 hypothetical protein BM1_08228 [Bipolaris maydis]ENI02486.1 hypothetical protein COCC4DRAFT_144971 [Bipolaris maydis ATCC 48331]KAJ5021365.1 hypothetical protein J3E73DRAFT_403229 [Bipolaris maydis]KAJ5061363.1 hypothetical protein J3E74DRAFT_451737 [Bipolaris maydis]
MAIAKPSTTLPHRQQSNHLTVPTTTSSSSVPSISASPLFSASTHDIAMLHDIHSLLNKLFIRNRNQHRRSTWWKALHGFRKQMALLLGELEAKELREYERRQRVEARLRFWDERGEVHAWYYQFSQLVAVGPFSMLGLVMMASVARVCRITGITSVYEQIASAEVKGVLDASDGLGMAGQFESVLGGGDECDEGVVIAREDED